MKCLSTYRGTTFQTLQIALYFYQSVDSGAYVSPVGSILTFKLVKSIDSELRGRWFESAVCPYAFIFLSYVHL